MGRAWIIGNGPSLANTNLDLLLGETTFATNRIYRAFKDYRFTDYLSDETSEDAGAIRCWRPTYYVRQENSGIRNIVDATDISMIKHHCVMFLHKGLSGLIPWNKINPRTRVEWFWTCQHGWPYEKEYVEHEWHLGHANGLHNICNFGSSVHAAMQIAVVLGFGPLYLLGCDLGYVDGANNHFCEGYDEGYTLRPAADVNRTLYGAHKMAAKCSPVPIYNATVGGSLDIYPRVVMEDVIKS